MYNEYYERLNPMLKKDYKLIEKECEKILYSNAVYDVITFLNDFIYDLSDVVNNNFYLAICELEDYYMGIYKNNINIKR
jgi:hypothetical protein